MRKTVKITLSVITAVFLLVIIAAAALPYIFGANRFKPRIEAAVKEKIGRELTIQGDLEFSVFPWLGVSTEKLVLSNAPGFQGKPFAEIGGSRIKVKLLPLLAKKIEVDRVVLTGLVLNLAKNKNGGNNWDDLAAGSPTSASQEPASIDESIHPRNGLKPLGGLAIAGITLKNANIDWTDEQAGSHLIVKDINFETDHLAFAEPIALKLNFSIENPAARLDQSVKLAAGLIVNENLDRFTFQGIELNTEFIGPSLPSGSITAQLNAQAIWDIAKQQLNVSDLRVVTGDIKISGEITGEALEDHPAFDGAISVAQFNPASQIKRWGFVLPAMRDADALSVFSADFTLQANSHSADIQNLIVRLDESTIKGSTRIDDFDRPAVTFNLTVDAVDADRYFAPEARESKPAEPITSPAAAAAGAASLFPVETLRTLNATGLLSIDRLKFDKINMQGVHLKLTAQNGLIQTEHTIDGLYQGVYAGGLNLDVRNETPVLTLNEKIGHVQVEPFLKDVKGEAGMSGIVDASAQLQGRGNDQHTIKSSLNGHISFLFKNGIIKGFNLQQIIDNAKSLIKGTPLAADNPKDQTFFSEIRGTAQVDQGIIVNKDLLAKSSKVRAEGEGSADLKTEKLDYTIRAQWLGAEASEVDPEKIKTLPVIIHVKGNFNNPEYSLDVAKILIEQNKEKIEQKKEKLLEKLDKKLGPGARDILKKFF